MQEQQTETAGTIDPRNPFDNPTENRDYNLDYSDILPPVTAPGYTMPVLPAKLEQHNIRRFYNLGGGMLLLHLVATNIIATVLYAVFPLVLSVADRRSAGALPDNYDTIVSNYISNSSLSMALNAFVFLLCNTGIFLLGCKWAKIPVGSLFQTKKLTVPTMLRYMGLGLFLQMVSALLATFVDDLLVKGGYGTYTPDFSLSGSKLQLAAMVLSTCLVAPITEELLYRGFFLKVMSRVSQRFGIFMSALFFSLAHENIAQGILTFLVGVLLGYIATKHDSIIPCILVHFTINSYSMLCSLLDSYNEELANMFSGLSAVIILVGGAVLFIYTLIMERLPDNTPRQSLRCGRIAIGAWPLVLTAAIHIGAALLYMGMNNG
ncbi:MAG: type II CAAX endopeptidase family protein [Ruminococcus callidus]|nr:type II CAAX endopeptidase family protein [Ruminococcus callidus]